MKQKMLLNIFYKRKKKETLKFAKFTTGLKNSIVDETSVGQEPTR